MIKIAASLILSLSLFCLAQAQRASETRAASPDLSVKELRFNGLQISPGVYATELIPVLQKKSGDKIYAAQTVQVRMQDSAGNAVVICDLLVPAWTGDETTSNNLPSCAVGTEPFSKITRFYVIADANEQVSETNETNNRLAVDKPSIITAGSAPGAIIPGAKKPDLVIHGFKFSSDFKKLIVTAKNICYGAAGPIFVAVDFHESGTESSKKVFTVGQKVLSLASGSATADVALDVSSFTHGNQVMGKNFITVTIDGNNLQAEAAEDNNYLKMGADGKGISPPAKMDFSYCQNQ